MSDWLPTSIRGRLVATYTLLFALAAGLLTIYLVDEARSGDQKPSRSEFGQTAADVTSLLQPAITAGENIVVRNQVKTWSAGERAQLAIVDVTLGEVISTDDSTFDDYALVIDMAETRGLDHESGGAEVFDVGASVVAVTKVPGSPDTRIVLSTPESEIQGSSLMLWARALAGLGIALVFIAALSWLISRKISEPLEKLSAHAAAFSAGDLTAAVEPEGPVDLRNLATAFNAMTDRIRGLIFESESGRQRLELIFENLSEGVLVVDSGEMVLAENRRAREILGTAGTLMPNLPFVVAVRDHDLLNHFRTTMRSGAGSTIPIEYARSGRSIEAAAIPVASERERFGIIVLRDVTEIRRLESVRKEFVANVSHELRTPLASIRALADTLESGAMEDPEVGTDFLQRIVREVDRLTGLVDELLDLARLDSGRVTLRLQTFPPSQVIAAGAERLQAQIERAGLTLRLDLDESLPDVRIDRERIEQVLLNLIHNAIKFTPAGGSITITARRESDFVRVEVVDTGQGIPDAELPRVFERFYKADRSRRSEGTGLGLAISKHIILAHHGEVSARHNPGGGSIFAFTLPVASQGSTASDYGA